MMSPRATSYDANMSTRRVKTNINKINTITQEFTEVLCEQIHLQKTLKQMHAKLSKHAEKMSSFANYKKPPNGYNLYFKNESKRQKKKGKTSGGPSFAKTVANRWNSLEEKGKNVWRDKVTRSGQVY